MYGYTFTLVLLEVSRDAETLRPTIRRRDARRTGNTRAHGGARDSSPKAVVLRWLQRVRVETLYLGNEDLSDSCILMLLIAELLMHLCVMIFRARLPGAAEFLNRCAASL